MVFERRLTPKSHKNVSVSIAAYEAGFFTFICFPLCTA